MNVLGELIQKIGFDVDTEGLKKVGEHLEGIHHLLEALFVVEAAKIFVELGKKIFELTEEFSELGEHLEVTAYAAGITTDELQQLSYAAGQNAVSQDELTGGLAKLNRQLYQAKEGSKTAVAIFAKLGIDQDQIASFQNSADALAAIQDKISGVDDANKKQALTMALFGRGSSNMVKFLSKGSEETERLKKESVELGATINKTYVENLAKFKEVQTSAKQISTAFFASIGATFAPAFSMGLKALEKLYGANQKAIQEGIKKAAEFVIYWVVYIGELFRLVGVAIAHIFKKFVYEPGKAAFDGLASAFSEMMDTFKGDSKFLEETNSNWTSFLELLGNVREMFSYVSLGIQTILWGLKGLLLYLDDITPGGGWNQIKQFVVDIFTIFFALTNKALEIINWVFEAINNLIGVIFGTKSFWSTGLGEFFSWIGKKGGSAADIINRFFGSKPGQSAADATSAATGGDYIQGGAAMLDKAGGMSMPFDPSSRINNAPAPAANISVSAPVTVNVPPGTSVEDARKMIFDEKNTALEDALNRAHRTYTLASLY